MNQALRSTLALADFAGHLSVVLDESGDQTLFSNVLVVEGDGYVSEAAIVGITEDLQNESAPRHDSSCCLKPAGRPRGERRTRRGSSPKPEVQYYKCDASGYGTGWTNLTPHIVPKGWVLGTSQHQAVVPSHCIQ